MNFYRHSIERIQGIRHLHLKAICPYRRPYVGGLYEPLIEQLKVLKKEETVRMAKARRRVRGVALSDKESARRAKIYEYLHNADQGWFSHPDKLLEAIYMVGQ